MIGGVAVTGGDVVFAGELTGDFLVFNANDGKADAAVICGIA
jgi:alcohol dehydrogenase (cytochrome c)